MNRARWMVAVFLLRAAPLCGQEQTLLPPRIVAALAQEVSGEAAKRPHSFGAASGYFLANLGPTDAPALRDLIQSASLRRTATMLQRRAELAPDETTRLTQFHLEYERAVVASLERFLPIPTGLRGEAEAFIAGLERVLGRPTAAPPPGPGGEAVYRRNDQPKGPMSVFEYDYLVDKYGEEKTGALRLLRFSGLRGGGDAYAYEALNFVDGHRTAEEIRNAVSAVYGPIPLEMVAEYLGALEVIGVVTRER